MADPYKLTSEPSDSKPTRYVWACDVCNCVHAKEDRARACCSCAGCGARSTRRHYLRCDACESAERERIAGERRVRELRLIAAAELVDLEDYEDEQVSTTPFGDEDSYHVATDCYATDATGAPLAWAWACTITTLGIGSLDAHDIVSGAVEEWFEGAADMFDVDRLQKLLDTWCESQNLVRCYYSDETRIVVLDPDRRDEVEAMVEAAKRELAELDGG